MKNSTYLVSIGALLAAVTFAPAAFAEEAQSGFLGDYSALAEVKDTAGDTVMRYISPKFKPGAYQKVMIDPTQYYPAPKPTDQVTASTLTEISHYVDKGLHAKLGTKVTLVSEAGPGVLRMRPAITAVAAQTPGLKPYQVIPIAFIISSAKGRGKEAAINIEVEMVDSMTGERLGASVRKGAGAKLASDKAPLLLKDVQPLLDKWIDTGSTFVAERMK
ncbi:MAG: DUF3313 domain-containing protein [Sulfurimicrobium sp.]|nr:DUF3313 domain-containing protein [Sulfurimicrobium sp.]